MLGVFLSTVAYVAFPFVMGEFARAAKGQDELELTLKIFLFCLGAYSYWFGLIRAFSRQYPERKIHATPSLSYMRLFTGPPSTMFVKFLLVILIPPALVVAIIWLGNLQVNQTFRAIFSILGFIWAYEILRVACIALFDYSEDVLKKGSCLGFLFISNLLFIHALFMPVFGYFLMWYFNWLPMKLWVKIIYSIFSFGLAALFVISIVEFYVDRVRARSLKKAHQGK
jgi:hypothetical protein